MLEIDSVDRNSYSKCS